MHSVSVPAGRVPAGVVVIVVEANHEIAARRQLGREVERVPGVYCVTVAGLVVGAVAARLGSRRRGLEAKAGLWSSSFLPYTHASGRGKLRVPHGKGAKVCRSCRAYVGRSMYLMSGKQESGSWCARCVWRARAFVGVRRRRLRSDT